MSAVAEFNRAGRALRMIMSQLLYLVNTSFFDDFCQMDVEPLVQSADCSALALLNLLGWDVSKGERLKGFSAEFSMLGARILHWDDL